MVISTGLVYLEKLQATAVDWELVLIYYSPKPTSRSQHIIPFFSCYSVPSFATFALQYPYCYYPNSVPIFSLCINTSLTDCLDCQLFYHEITSRL